MSTVAPASAEAAQKGRYLALTAMVFATGMTFIDMTIVSIGAPVIESDLGISDDAVQWVVNGYLLGLAATFALMGRVADVYGHRRMVIIGTIVFAFSSLMCGLTPSGNIAAAWLIGWRVVEGVGAAMLFPAALAIVVAAFPPAGRGRALALFFAITGGLTAIGPIVGGYLVDWNWRSIFWVNIPIAIIALILTAIAKPTTERRDEPIDWIGALLTIVGMGLSVLGFQQAGSWGWSSPLTWSCIVGGLVVLIAFVRYELGRQYPLIKMKIFADRAFQADNAVLFFMSMALRAGVLLPERLRPSRAGVQRARGWPLSDVVLHRIRHRIPDRRGDPGSQRLQTSDAGGRCHRRDRLRGLGVQRGVPQRRCGHAVDRCGWLRCRLDVGPGKHRRREPRD